MGTNVVFNQWRESKARQHWVTKLVLLCKAETMQRQHRFKPSPDHPPQGPRQNSNPNPNTGAHGALALAHQAALAGLQSRQQSRRLAVAKVAAL